MSPTRLPRSVKRRASRAMAVVLPAPRKPPIMMYRARAGVTSPSFMALPKHLVDRRVQHGHITLGVQAVFAGSPFQGVEPASPRGVGLDQLDLFAQPRFSSQKTPGNRRKKSRPALEPFDPPDRLPGFPVRPRLALEGHFPGFPQHPNRKLRESDSPEVAFLPPQ